MATNKSKWSSNSKLNFRPSVRDGIRGTTRGTKPTSEPTSIKEIATLMVLHMCRKSLFYDVNLKVALYLGALFIISLLADVFPVPKSYFSKSSNVFNQYFVKICMGMEFDIISALCNLNYIRVLLWSKRQNIKASHSTTGYSYIFWWFWTTLFQIVESHFGRCTVKGEQYKTKQTCLKASYLWNGFDISGHSFILIYGSLVLMEEVRSMLNWESIKEYIRLEEHYRNTNDTSSTTNPLHSLSDEQFKFLCLHYEKFTPYIRGLFVLITLLQILWDLMLISTILYFHVMVEKFLAGICAILTWFFTYRFWYMLSNIVPMLPGEGLFKYLKHLKNTPSLPVSRRSVDSSRGPTFMGMPLYSFRSESNNIQVQER